MSRKEHCIKIGMKTRFKKCNIPWIKGKKGIFKQSDEFKEYMKKRMSGKNNPMYGMNKNKAPNFKGGRPKCLDCGKLLSTYIAKKCKNCAKKGLLVLDKNGRWNGGKSFEKYPPIFNNQLKERVRVRDNFICKLCGIPELECKRRLHIHHIDYDKKNCSLINLISLCNSCHVKTNLNRDEWKALFLLKIEDFNANLRS